MYMVINSGSLQLYTRYSLNLQVSTNADMLGQLPLPESPTHIPITSYIAISPNHTAANIKQLTNCDPIFV